MPTTTQPPKTSGGGASEWKLEVHFQAIMGVVERNMALVGQLVKVN